MYPLRCISNPTELLRSLLILMVLRRHNTMAKVSYEDMQVEYPQFADEILQVTYRVRESANVPLRERAFVTLAFGMGICTLLSTMTINLEELDVCSLLRVEVAKNIAEQKHCYNFNFVWDLALAITTFGSRQFNAGLHNLSMCRVLTPKLFLKWVRHLIVKSGPRPWHIFTGSYCPNRIRRNQLKKCRPRRRRLVAIQLWKLFRARAGDGSILKENLSKRALQERMAERMGPFTAKNCFRTLGRLLPNRSQYRGTVLRSHRYSLTGPGARTALNLLQGWAKSYSVKSKGGPEVSAVYSDLLLDWHQRWHEICKDFLEVCPPSLRHHVLYFVDYEQFDELGFQFLLCELSKIVNFVETENVSYTRGYKWP